jgi:hypothetical protein
MSTITEILTSISGLGRSPDGCGTAAVACMTLPHHARKRKSHVKRRSGCRTCKLRRVRCDEEHPKCRNCERRGLNCDGYLPMEPVDVLTVMDPGERRSFRYFHIQTRPQLRSLPEFNFWDQLALQRSYSEHTVRQIAIAIGAFHEHLENRDGAYHAECYNSAERLYQKAIMRTTNALSQMSTADVLLASILLAFLDNVRGDEWSAYMHISGATAILSEHESTAQGRSWMVTKVVAPIVVNLATRLHALYAPIPAFLPEPVSEAPFTSFLDAYDKFRSVVDSITKQIRSLSPPSATEVVVFDRLESWWETFSSFLGSPKGSSCSCEWPYNHAHARLGALFLEIIFLTTRPRLHCAWTRLELVFDLYEPSYHRILDACEQLAHILESCPNMDTSAGKCIGIRPVYFRGCWMVAEESRDPALRRRAIRILRRWHRVDHAFDTLLIADAAECLMLREEAGSPVQPVLSCRNLPESARIRFLIGEFFEVDAKTSLLNAVYEAHRCDFVKISILRQSDDDSDYHAAPSAAARPVTVIEALWVDRRRNAHVGAGYSFAAGMPISTGGFFRQVTAPNQTKLWSMLYETRSAEELLTERRWEAIDSPIDRVLYEGDDNHATARDEPAEQNNGDRLRPRRVIWQGRLPSTSTPIRKLVSGASMRTIVHDVC